MRRAASCTVVNTTGRSLESSVMGALCSWLDLPWWDCCVYCLSPWEEIYSRRQPDVPLIYRRVQPCFQEGWAVGVRKKIDAVIQNIISYLLPIWYCCYSRYELKFFTVNVKKVQALKCTQSLKVSLWRTFLAHWTSGHVDTMQTIMRKGRISWIWPGCSLLHRKDRWSVARCQMGLFHPASRDGLSVLSFCLFFFSWTPHVNNQKSGKGLKDECVRLYLIYNHPSLTKWNDGTCSFPLLSMMFINLCRCIMSIIYCCTVSRLLPQPHALRFSAGLSLIKQWVKTVRPLLLCVIHTTII